MTDREVVTVDDFRRLLERENRAKPEGLPEDRLQEYAIAALAQLRGLAYADKHKVVRRMTKMLRS